MKSVIRPLLIGVIIALGSVALWIAPNASATEPQAAVQTLILTNKARLTELYGSSAVDSLILQLNQLAAHGAVNGSVILVEETPAVASAYAAWQTTPTDTALANAVADAIHTLIMDKTPTTPDLHYIVLVGDDRVLPYRRVLDETPNSRESGYDQVPATTTVGAALENNQILTDDFYGDIQATQPITLYLPELAVGRLVETPSEMGVAITRFLQSDGKIVTTNNLVVGHDFLVDAAQTTCTTLVNTGVPTDCALIGNTWTATMLDSKLQSSPSNVVFLYAGGNHWQTGTPTVTLTSTLVSAWPVPSGGRLIYTLGSHNGLNVPPETTQPLDWPQAWLAQGNVHIASTGYALGLLNSIGYSEKLAVQFAQNLSAVEAASVGDALIKAKQTYEREDQNLSGYDKKIVAEVVLHGLPMYKVEKSNGSATATPIPPSYQPGALILVAGRARNNDPLQTNIHNVTNATYQLFRQHNYLDEKIYYLATDSTLSGYDAAATVENLSAAITTWAVNKVDDNRPLTLYLMSYGEPDNFPIDNVNNQKMSSSDLNLWLSQLESAVPGVEINIVLEAGIAGTFIEGTATVSKAGRVIITSTDATGQAYASATGARFSDVFLAQFGASVSLQTAFTTARQAVVAMNSNQQPWLDADGNSTPNQISDETIAANRFLFSNPLPATSTPTNIATATATPPVTPTPTTTSAVTLTPTVGDSYEGDNACGIARAIANNGETQIHTFHQQADVDWVSFDAVANTDYRIEVNVADPSPADVNLELYTVCDGVLVDQWSKSFSPGARLNFTPVTTGKVYVRLANFDATVAGAHVRYEVGVHNLATAPTQRALVIVAGRLRGSDQLQKNIHTIAEAVYQTFQRNGYTDDNIYYLATNASLLGYDAAASKASLRTAITQWAVDKVKNNGVFTLYLIDHGHPDRFYIDELSGQRVSPDELNGWLSELEAAAPGVTVNVIIEACQSGSFIDKPSSISKAGRMVITSTNAQHDAKASQQGAYFSDHLLTQLSQGYNLAASFRAAQQVAKQVYVFQEAWLDADGNGVANEFGDATLAAQRGFAYAGTFGDEWPPHIFQVQTPISITNASGKIQANVRDDAKVSQVWAVVYPPDYVAPTTSQELQAETLPSFNLTATGVEDFYAGVYPGFTQAGIYQIVIHATDNNGLVATPRTIEVRVGSQLFLPLIQR